jgi:epoxyqueuosine reductase QueG
MQAQAVEQTFIETALSLGFDLAAIAPISLPEKDTTAFKDFVAEGRHGKETIMPNGISTT